MYTKEYLIEVLENYREELHKTNPLKADVLKIMSGFEATIDTVLLYLRHDVT